MWKFISRGVRAPFERGGWSNRAPSDQTGAASQENKFQLPCPFKFIPCFLEKCQHYAPFCPEGKGQTGQGTDSNDQHSTNAGASSGPFNNEHVGHQPCAILGAVGWSGILVLGWTILQPWYRHKSHNRKPIAQHDLRPDALNRYTGLYNLLVHPALSQPVNRQILPQLSSPSSFISSSAVTDSLDSAVPVQLNDAEITPEEAFDKAAEEVRQIHERVVGEAENRRGVMCMSLSQNNEAIEHFRIASGLRYAPAAFNLGQCYELGIGTRQDFAQAAHWYQTATDLGHATAMYNLGVFYAHGWGGLSADSKRARQLFVAAAALGQTEAQAALQKVHKQGKETKPKDLADKKSESYSILDFIDFNKLSVKVSQPQQQEIFAKTDDEFVRLHRGGSLSSSPSTPSSLSSSSSGSSTDDHLPPFYPRHHQDISTIEEFSEAYSDASSSDDEWEISSELANMNGNSTTLYRLAMCYEQSPSAEHDPDLILQLYQMAADHGHEKARRHLKVLEQQQQLGTLSDYLKKKRQKMSPSSLVECAFQN